MFLKTIFFITSQSNNNVQSHEKFLKILHKYPKPLTIMNQIRVESLSIPELFSLPLDIPEYQRPYVWTKNEVLTLLKDIYAYQHHSQEEPMYYLGSIILHEHDNLYSIIDGQQRITTLAILLHILSSRQEISIKYHSPVSMENIRKNAQIIREFCTGKDINEHTLQHINVTLVITQQEDDAYTFFETQNTGGVRLSGIDIIKAHHLRYIGKDSQNEYYARKWEQFKYLDEVTRLLLLGRRWNILHWEKVPPKNTHGDYTREKQKKQIIIDEFSNKTLNGHQKIGFQQVQLEEEYRMLHLPPYKLALRQPLYNGENFIDYLDQFVSIYQNIFIKMDDLPEVYVRFTREVIDVEDRTEFVREFYQVVLISYVSRFGTERLIEAALQIFRYTYVLRLQNNSIREKSIPKFIQENHFIIDEVLTCYTCDELMKVLQSFEYDELDPTLFQKGYAADRLFGRISEFFRKELKDKALTAGSAYDKWLCKNIQTLVNQCNVSD